MWKCVDPELEWQIRCFPYGERSDVPRLQQVGKKPSDGRGISDYMYKSTRPTANSPPSKKFISNSPPCEVW